MNNINFTTINIKNVVGIDHEPSDTDVNILNDSFTLIFTDDKDHQYQLEFMEADFNILLTLVKPFIDADETLNRKVYKADNIDFNELTKVNEHDKL